MNSNKTSKTPQSVIDYYVSECGKFYEEWLRIACGGKKPKYPKIARADKVKEC